MELTLLVYLVGVVSQLSNILGVTVFLLFMVSVCLISFSFESPGSTLNGYYIKNIKKCVVLTAVFTTMLLIIPSERTMWVMTGTYATQHFTESKDSCFNHEKVIRYINNRIEGLLTEGDK